MFLRLEDIRVTAIWIWRSLGYVLCNWDGVCPEAKRWRSVKTAGGSNQKQYLDVETTLAFKNV